MARFKLSKRELDELNAELADCAAIADDIEAARLAGVPNMDVLQEKLDICKQRIEKLKATYAVNKK